MSITQTQHAHHARPPCRFAVVFYEGGVYADLDVEAYNAIHYWAPQPACAAALTLENDKQFGQYAFAAEPRHPLFGYMLWYLETKLKADKFAVAIPGSHSRILCSADTGAAERQATWAT
jgi:hypothetical protein